jgi:hypothetical protein
MQTIDIHAHWYPAEWLALFEKDGPKRRPITMRYRTPTRRGSSPPRPLAGT